MKTIQKSYPTDSFRHLLVSVGSHLLGVGGIVFIMNEDIVKLKQSLMTCVTKFNDTHKIFYMTKGDYQIKLKYINRLIDLGGIKQEEADTIKVIYKVWCDNYSIIKELDSNEPRVIAQKFIAKKNIRNFIFKRDKSCLRCGSSSKLELDHINPISQGGENSLSNLQTLCKKCNCIKNNTYKDYRNGR